MITGYIEGYLSRAQVRIFMEFILKEGTESIVETRDGLYNNAASTEQMLAGAISSVKEFHMSRFLYEKTSNLMMPSSLRQITCTLTSDDSKPELPEGTLVVGIFYMSKLGRDFTASAGYKGDVGDVFLALSEEYDSLDFSTTETGVNNRLVVSWGEKNVF